MNRKAQFHNHWPEIVGFFFLILGMVLALAAPTESASYIIVFIVGVLGGRLWWHERDTFKTSWFIILLGFLIGYIIGGWYTNRNFIVVFFIAGAWITYWLHEKGILSSTEI